MKANLKTMRKKNLKQALRTKRKIKVRKRIKGSAECPRLSVYKSLKHMYVQAIDDVSGTTLASASTTEKSVDCATKKLDVAGTVGELIAQRLKDKKVSEVVFDRNGFKYTGRVSALADAARKAGLEF